MATKETYNEAANVDLTERGTRRPRHHAAVTTPQGRLQPIFAAPLRPNETLTNVNIKGWSQFAQMVKTTAMPPLVADLMVAIVPLSAYGEEMKELVLTDLRDNSHVPRSNQADHDGEALSASGFTNIRDFALYRDEIKWAGMPSTSVSSVDTFDMASWVPKGTEIIAKTFYDYDDTEGYGPLENVVDGNSEWGPQIGDPVRGTLRESINMDLTSLDAISGNLADVAQRLSAVGKPDQTYIEYLAGYGVTPSSVQSMPEIVMWERELLMPEGSPQMFGHISAGATGLGGIWGSITKALGGADFIGDEGGMRGARQVWQLNESRNFHIKEPSILIGYVAWWPFQHKIADTAHYLDICTFNNAGSWGNPVAGLDEADFIGAGAVAAQQDRGATPGSTNRMWNKLNLYLNGDSFCNDVDAFEFFGIGNDPLTDDNRRVNTFADIRLQVATDLVQ
jgi:hypothetical protein